MKFKEIAKGKLKKDDYIWRYIDLPKLIDLATNLELHFTRTDRFSDPFEGVTYKLIAERYYARNSEITNSNIDEGFRMRHDASNKKKLADYVDESSHRQRTQFINCWIKSQWESVAMWNLYSNRNSVAIRAKAGDMIEYFKRNLDIQPLLYPDYEFICGSITYLRLNPFDPHDKTTLPEYSSFKKDVAYDFEKEFRFLIVTPKSESDSNPEFFRFKISNNFMDLIEIVCHPEMEHWKYKNITELCKRMSLPEPSMSKTEMRM